MDDDLLASIEFRELVRRADRGVVLKRELDSACIPAGRSVDEIWDALTDLRKSFAYYGPILEYLPEGIGRNWHTVPASLRASLQELSKRAQKGSQLDTIAAERKGARFMTQFYIEEAVANLSHDGFDTDYESVRAVITGERPCIDDAERIALNFHGIMRSLDRYEELPFDAGTILDFYDELTCEIPPDRLDAAVARTVLAPHASPLEPERMREQAMSIVVATGNDLMLEPTQDPIMVSMLVNCHFWRFAPMRSCNNLMGCIASRFYLVKKRLPAFRFLPKTKILEEWRRGSRFGGVARYAFDEVGVLEGRDTDWTAYYDTFMAIMLHMLEQMESALLGMKAADELLIERIAAIPYLNLRQRAILRRAVLDPETEFTIARHRQANGIVYSTARSDFETLVEKGYLLRVSGSGANTYLSVPNLRKLLAQ